MSHWPEVHIVRIIHPYFKVDRKVIADIYALDIYGIYHVDQSRREGGDSKSLAFVGDAGFCPSV